MLLKLQLLLFAVTMITLLGVHAELDASENTELFRQAPACREVNQDCYYPTKPCCHQRPCVCSMSGLFSFNCKCKRF
uniref:Putative neurotoxin LTDF S-10 n=1 Tax=Dolomedes fimbriatus TaxID=1432569 RepID=A0A0K1D9C8_9ARAC|nr:putative neurotoxin LTDF S-10 [Dolomedes fimbriatus]